MGEWFPNAPDPVNDVLDVPADAANATTGTGEDLGWFGKIDRGLDPRNIANDEWADPSAATSGLSGFFDAGIGATTSLGRNAGSVTVDPALAYLGLGGSSSGSTPSQPTGQQPDQPDQPDETDSGGIGLMTVAVIGIGALGVLGVLR